jgi:glutamine synthetase
MRRYDIITEICDAMLGLGWAPYQNDHEDANGQFEMNWTYDEALLTADRMAFFKFMAKSVAEKHGLRATFMPKPFANLTGNGCHIHLSLWQGETNLFDGGEDITDLAKHFIGGVLNSAPAMAAITNPTVNSYKRINAPRTVSGATWSPNSVTWTGNNRTHMIRVPEPDRFELRLADGATNPYLLPAVALAAGLDGMARQIDPGPRQTNNMYTEGHLVTGTPPKLPLNMLDALRALEASEVLTAAMPELVPAYLKLKNGEWNDYARHLTQWERDTTLDC